MVSEGRCPVAEGELLVRSSGEGPHLLMIPGGVGGKDTYRALARHLEARFTVVTYDRRGHFGSTDASIGPIPVERHADDAHAVIASLGEGPVRVFGSSAGAVIALDLVARHPDDVTTLVAHEPPAVRLMPDAQRWVDDARSQVELSRSGDVMAAFTRFTGRIAGAALPDLRAVRLPHEKEWAFLFDREIEAFYTYQPDLAALRRSGVEIVAGAGEHSRGHHHYQPARQLALELGLPFVEFPGAHLGPQRNPREFAAALLDCLE